jgi:hypothetical protein
MTPEEIAAAIRQLTAPQLLELGRLLHNDDGWWETVGVVAKPGPESPGDAIAGEIPPDYWETAQ